MPQEHSISEIVERSYGAWNDDDLEAMLALTHPEAEYTPSGVFPGMDSVIKVRDGLLYRLVGQPASEQVIRGARPGLTPTR